MMSSLSELPQLVLRASLFLSIAATVVLFLSAAFRYPRLERGLWLLVIFQGLILLRFELVTDFFPREPEAVSTHTESPQAVIPLALDEVVFDAAVAPNDVVSSLPPSATKHNAWFYLAVTWLVGMAITFGWQFTAYVRFLRGVSYTECLPDWQDEWNAIRQRDRNAPIAVLRATLDTGPLLCRTHTGYEVLVPAEQWSILTAEQRKTILHHEWAHLRRGDVWKSAAIRLLALPHWFNPFAWIAIRRFEDCAEWACDDATRTAMPDAMSDYARALLELGRSKTSQTTPSLASAASGRPLVERIQRVLSPLGKDTVPMKMKVLFAIAIVASLTVVNSVRVVRAAQENPKQSDDRGSAEPATLSQHASSTVEGTRLQVKNDLPTAGNAVSVVNGVLASPGPGVGGPGPGLKRSERQQAGQGMPVTGVPIGLPGPPHVPAATGVARDETAVRRDDEAVVDMPRLFQKHPGFVRDRERLNALIAAKDAEAAKLGKKEDAKALQQFRLAAREKLMREESRIYLRRYREVQSEIAAYARQNGIRLVRRLGTQPASVKKAEEMTPKQVIDLLNRPIVFIDNKPRDITQAIIDRLIARDKRTAEATRDSSAPARSTVPVLGSLPVIGEVFIRQTDQ